jgi:hypothetical protein
MDEGKDQLSIEKLKVSCALTIDGWFDRSLLGLNIKNLI